MMFFSKSPCNFRKNVVYYAMCRRIGTMITAMMKSARFRTVLFRERVAPSAVSDGKHGSVSQMSHDGSEIQAFPFGADRVNRVASRRSTARLTPLQVARVLASCQKSGGTAVRPRKIPLTMRVVLILSWRIGRRFFRPYSPKNSVIHMKG